VPRELQAAIALARPALRYTCGVKIALVSGSAGDARCGVGDYACELAQHLALDAEVHLYFDKQHGPARPPFEKLTSLTLHPLGGFSLLGVRGLAAKLRDAAYDIVHIQYPSKGYGTSVGPGFLPQQLAGMQSRSRILLTLHEWSTSHPLRRMVTEQMLPHIDALVVSSEQEMQALQPKLGSRPTFVLPVGNVLASRAELEAVWQAAAGQPAAQLPPPRSPFVGVTHGSPSSVAGSGDGPVAVSAGGTAAAATQKMGDLSVASTQRVPYSLFHYGLPAKGKGFERLLGALQIVREAGLPAVLHLGGDFSPGDKLTEELLALITEHGVADAVERLGHVPQLELPTAAERCWLGVFPFDEGFSSKRSSVASISLLDLPLAVGAGSSEQHPYYAPPQNTAADLAVLITELFTGRLAEEWAAQVTRQREYARRFSFGQLAAQYLDIYRRLRQVDA